MFRVGPTLERNYEVSSSKPNADNSRQDNENSYNQKLQDSCQILWYNGIGVK
jgi:hypothetical protein